MIHRIEDPLNNPGSDKVSFRAWQVGTLGDNGILEPVDRSPAVKRYEFRVEEIEGQRGLFLAKAPAMLLLTDDALDGLSTSCRTIYFWNTDTHRAGPGRAVHGRGARPPSSSPPRC